MVDLPFPVVTRAKAISLGLSMYFTGVPCRNGHLCLRHVEQSTCVECRSMWSRKGAERHREARKQYLIANGAIIEEKRLMTAIERAARRRAQRLKRYHDDPDKHRAAMRAYRKANPDRMKRLDRKYYLENIDAKKSHSAAWQKRYPEKKSAINHNRRSRQAAAGGTHTAADVADIRRMQKDRCAEPSCRCKLNGKGHIDHIIPIARGGNNDRRNLQLLCKPCNMRKQAKDPIKFAQEMGRLL